MAWLKLETKHDPAAPTKRECHTICTAGERLVLFGGNDDIDRFREVHILNTVTLRWKKITPTDSAPGKRSAHSAVMNADGSWMYVFGGWNGTSELGDVSRFNIDTHVWEQIRPSGIPPAPRHFQMAARVGHRMLIFGGYDGVGWRADIAVLNLVTHAWEPAVLPVNTPAPGPRASGTFTVIEGDRVLLFGGYDGAIFLNDLWVLHVDNADDAYAVPTYTWEAVPSTGRPRTGALGTPVGGSGGAVSSLLPAVDWPLARSGHGGEAVGSLLIIVAGRHATGRNNDVFILDCARGWNWHACPHVGEPLKARKTHAVGRVGSRLFVMGGHSGTEWCGDLHVLDLSAVIRSFVSKPTIALPPSTFTRDFAAMAALPSNVVAPRRSALGVRGAAALAALADALEAERHACTSALTSTSPNGGACDEVAVAPAGAASTVDAEREDEGRPFSLLSYERFFRERFGGIVAGAGAGADMSSSFSADVGGLAPRLGSVISSPDSSFLSALSSGSAIVATAADEMGDGGGGVSGRSAGAGVGAGTGGAPRRVSFTYANVLDASQFSVSHLSEEAGGATQDSVMDDSGEPQARSSLAQWRPRPGVLLANVASPTRRSSADRAGTVGLTACGGAPEDGEQSSRSGVSGFGIGGIYAEGLFADVVYVVEGTRVPLHRAVLAARSEYFFAMLTRGAWSEASASAQGIVLKDVSLPVFLAAVRYLYTDCAPPIGELDTLVVPLLAFAGMIALPRLAALCERHLEAALDVDNASAILDVADSLGTSALRRAAMRFIIEHYEAVSASPTFVGLRENLLREVLLRRSSAAAAAAVQPSQPSDLGASPGGVADAPIVADAIADAPALLPPPAPASLPPPVSAPAMAVPASPPLAALPIVQRPLEQAEPALFLQPPAALAIATSHSEELQPRAVAPDSSVSARSAQSAAASGLASPLSTALFSPWAAAAATLSAGIHTLQLTSPLARVNRSEAAHSAGRVGVGGAEDLSAAAANGATLTLNDSAVDTAPSFFATGGRYAGDLLSDTLDMVATATAGGNEAQPKRRRSHPPPRVRAALSATDAGAGGGMDATVGDEVDVGSDTGGVFGTDAAAVAEQGSGGGADSAANAAPVGSGSKRRRSTAGGTAPSGK